jgi:hypothetical protein
MSTLRTIVPSQKKRAESSAAAAQDNESHEAKDQRGYHHNCETIGGFYKVQEGLDLGTGIARGRLLDLVKHFASYFCTFMKDRQGQSLQNGRHSEKQDAAEGSKPGSGSAPDQGSWVSASRESDGQKSSTERRHKGIQTKDCKAGGDCSREGARLQVVSPAYRQRAGRNA